MKCKKIVCVMWCVFLLNAVNCNPSNQLHSIKRGQYSVLVADYAQENESYFTRDFIQLGDGDPTVLTGCALFDNYANVLCGALIANSTQLWYDTPAFHGFTIIPTFQNRPAYPQAIFLSNGFVFFFRNQSYTAAQIASGAVLPIVQPNNVVYHKGTNTVSGFFGLGGGFTILPDASASMSTLITITGPLDLRETGTLILSGDLTLASHLTLSSGGKIDGQGHTLMLGGNLTFPENKIFHIMSDTVIDGQGYTLSMGDYGQLFVDNAVTVTLKNMTFSSGAKTSIFPPLRCAGSQSKLVLDNVTLLPGADIPFYQGQMFIYDDVHFTGTSAFVYTSPQSSFIMPSSLLTFDPSTTFSFAPATMSKDQIIMANATSSLVLDGCTLKCTDTGLRLTKGALTYQGNVTVDTKNSFYFSSLTTATMVNYGTSSSYVYAAAWSPDGKYLAIGGYGPTSGAGGFTNTDELRIYQFNGTTLTPVTSRDYGYSIRTLAWGPDGNYLALGGQGPTSGDELQIYEFNGATLTPVTGKVYAEVFSVAWSPDGKYLATGGYGNVKIYQFNGITLRSVTDRQIANQVYSVAWSPDGGYLAIGGYSPLDGNELQIHQFNGTTLTPVAGIDYGWMVNSLAWSPDGRYLAIGGYLPLDGNELQIYQFNETKLTPVTSRDYGVAVYSLAWSSDGKYLAIGGSSPTSGGTTGFDNYDRLRLYKFNGTMLTPVTSRDYGYSIRTVAWSVDGNYLAIGGNQPLPSLNNSECQIYAPVLGENPNPQALTNSLVYGNSVLGSSANLTVNGAPTTLRGQIFTENDGFNAPVLNLNSDTTIASNSILHITRNTIIEGGAHTLTAGDYGQLFVDNAVTVTLKNMIFSSGAKTSIFPPLCCAGSQSKLVLDNVTLLPGADIPFYQGQIFIYDDVHFTGTSAFVYTSPQSSFIMPSSLLTFDPSTTFSFAPATVSKDQIIMSNATSSLVFNGSTLKCTDTGLRLSKGSLTYQGSVTVDTKNGFYFSSLTTATMVNYGTGGSIVYSAAWSPDGNYLAIGGYLPASGAGGFNDTNELRIYGFNGRTLTPITSRDYGTYLYSAVWSPDGKYLAIGGQSPASGGATGFANNDELRIYEFNGTTLTPLTSSAFSVSLNSVAWSPDGNYLLLVGSTNAGGNEIRIYQFNGIALTFVTGQRYGNMGVTGAWSPDGSYLAIGGNGAGAGKGGFANTDEIRIYRFNETTLTPVTSKAYGIVVRSFSWSPDGKYLAIGGSGPVSGAGGFANTDELRLYRFDGTILTPVTSKSYGDYVHSVAWNPNGNYLAVGGGWPPGVGTTNQIMIYQFDGTVLASVASQNYGNVLYCIAWNPDGNYLAIGGKGPLASLNYSEVQIYAPVLGANPNPQALTNSLVYGNSALGSGANLTVDGAPASVRGNVLNQNV